MENSSRKNARKNSGVRQVNVAIRTLSINEAIAEALKGWPAKQLARIVKTNIRTVENWKQAKTGPQVKHVAAMMTDDELCAALLAALGRRDVARHQQTI